MVGFLGSLLVLGLVIVGLLVVGTLVIRGVWSILTGR
mgnify:CR=1 FL=1